MSHIISYAFEPTAHKYHQTQADTSGNIQVAVRGTWADDMVEDTDQMVSKLTDMTTHTGLISSRTSNIQDWIGTSDGLGGGVKTGVNIAEILVDTDQCVSKLTDISTNAGLTASRASNIQDWVGTSDGVGGGVKTGVNIATMKDDINSIFTRQFTISGTQANLMSGASCVAAGTTSSVVDWFSQTAVPKRVSILITATASVSSSGVEVYGSADNSTYGLLTTITPTQTNRAGGAINTTGGVVMDWSCRYLKIINYSLGTYTATAIGLS